MSSETRKYQLKARAESQRETRDRIARAAAELHEQKGPAHTTVAEIARLAGVTRLTVYNHFDGLDALLPACSAHYQTLHPAPDFEESLTLVDPAERVTRTLELLYAWFRETEAMFSKVYADRIHVPEVDRFVDANLDRMARALATGLADSLDLAGDDSRRSLLRLAVDFWSWRRLWLEGLSDRDAAALMAGTVLAPTLSR
jgi:AcrR family transcriptional regulator